jgi:hypothetical protein
MFVRARHVLAACFVLGGLTLAACKDDAKSEGGDKKSADKEEKADKKESKKDDKVASCNRVKTDSFCSQYGSKNIEAAGEDFLKKGCDDMKGSYAKEACPADKRVGSCTSPEGVKVFYKDGPAPLDAAAAEKNCKEVLAGTWKSDG